MTSVTVIKPPTRNVAAKRDGGITIHNTIRDCARKELEKLSAEFFDAVDDFLFLSGTNGQFAEDSSYLRAMREMRAKQSLFEEAFLQLTLATLFPLSKEATKEQLSAPRHLIDRHAAVFEMLEIDLALRSMHRKAQKHYVDHCAQVDALVAGIPAVATGEPNKQFALVSSSLWAFGESQRVFILPLEIRLVVIKLFEQHFLLKLTPLFQAVIGILKSARSGSAASKPNLTIARFQGKDIGAGSARDSQDSDNRVEKQSDNVDALVDAAIRDACQGHKLPAALVNVIESSWRPVMFLVGRNRGCKSHDWLESQKTLQLLVSMSVGKTKDGEADLEKLRKGLREGFELLQMPAAEQKQALDNLEQYLIPLQAIPDSVSPPAKQVTKAPEASISPSGKQILDRDDLREICDMLDASSSELKNPSMEDELLACLPDLDAAGATATIEYKINGKFQLCSLRRNTAKPGMYNINDRHSKITITRSRLGLAISMKAGELRFTGVRSPSVVAKTVFETNTAKPKS